MKSKEPSNEVIEHWYTLIASQHFSAKDFYDHISREIDAQRVPNLEISRVDLAEGGPLSDKREYLRLQRERIRFEVSAAPVGVNYFFSYRFYALPAVVQPWEMAVFMAVTFTLFDLSTRYVGYFWGPLLVLVLFGFLVWLMRNAIAMGLRDIDAALLKIPIVAPIYERYFRKDTFYRQDLRIAYGSIVSGIVKQEVQRLTAAKGVQLLREYTHSPVGDLYRLKETTPTLEPTPA